MEVAFALWNSKQELGSSFYTKVSGIRKVLKITLNTYDICRNHYIYISLKIPVIVAHMMQFTQKIYNSKSG